MVRLRGTFVYGKIGQTHYFYDRDFRLKRVVSINASGHKYGLTYPGVGWAIWRSPEYLPKELIFNINYLGSDQVSSILFDMSHNSSDLIWNTLGFFHFEL